MPRLSDDNDTEYDRHADRFGEQDDDVQDVTCNRCGADGLYWQDTWDAAGQRRPKLFEDGKAHVCKPNVGDFDVVGG